jgi:F-type H+-transporting ATPase subunit delta
MTNRTAGHRYARALFDVALQEKQDLAAIEQQLSSFGDLFTRHPSLGRVLLNPAVPVNRKRAAVAELTARAAVAPPVAKLLLLLAERDRLAILPELIAAFRDRLFEHQQIVRAEVTTVAPLTAERAEAIEKSLARLTGRTVTLSTKVDGALIGGVVARVGSTVYDASIAGQLRRLRQQLSDSI